LLTCEYNVDIVPVNASVVISTTAYVFWLFEELVFTVHRLTSVTEKNHLNIFHKNQNQIFH